MFKILKNNKKLDKIIYNLVAFSLLFGLSEAQGSSVVCCDECGELCESLGVIFPEADHVVKFVKIQ